eukprot:8540833-Ditylum_brightwellii.AAC.1
MLETDDLGQLIWWVDAAFAVHHDMQSHTGGLLMMIKGAVFATSTKQKLNTWRSTEAEWVGVNDVISQMLWSAGTNSDRQHRVS